MFQRLKLLFSLRDAVIECKERTDALETQVKQIELEWDETYDKFRTLTARLCKRAERNSAELNHTATPGDASEGTVERFSSLSPRAAEVQRQILARRNRMQMNGGHE